MTAVCCEQCFERIAREDPTAARIWLDLCAFQVKYGEVFEYREERVPTIVPHTRKLEEMGYMATADGGEAVRVIVLGRQKKKMNWQPYGAAKENLFDTFCIARVEHGNDDDEW
jgi:hypothetical protein